MKYTPISAYCLIATILFGLLAAYSCRSDQKDKDIQKLNSILEISTDTLQTDTKPLADTLLGMDLPYSGDAEFDIVYVSDSDCSICIVAAIRFVEKYLRSDWTRPIIIITKGDTGLFEYFLTQFELPLNRLLLIEAIEDAYKLKNGAYIVHKGRIIDFIKENKNF